MAQSHLSGVGNPVRGILLMIFAMALLSLGDMFVKIASAIMPVGQVLLLMSIGGSLVFIGLAYAQGFPMWNRRLLHPAVMARNGTELVGAIGMIAGIAFVPLSVYAVVIQMAPLLVTIAAAVLLKERIGPRRWIAVAVGFCGMLLVIQPGTEAFTAAALWPLLGITALSLRDVLTRLVPKDVSSVGMSGWGFLATLPAGPFMLALEGDVPDWPSTWHWSIPGSILAMVAGYFCVTTAMRAAPAAIVAPFRYTRLVFVLAIAMIVFNERPNGLMLIGAAIILGAGFYTFFRERQIARGS